VLLVGAAGWRSGAKSDDGGGSKTYNLLFDNAFGLTEGGDFKVAGVGPARPTSFKVVKWRPPARGREGRGDRAGLADLRRDARCEIRPQSLIGEYFVDCQPGASDERHPRRRPAAGRRRPARRSRSTWSTTSCGARTASACA
jgi:ABC-type transporter Mla subunit MlaD